MKVVRIRAHHLLCMQGFQGYGYDERFVANMTRVIEDLNSCPDREVEIIDECDVICFHCPHNQAGVCKKSADSPGRVKEMDLLLLRKLDLQKGARVKVTDVLSLADRKLRSAYDVRDVCGTCEWKEKCAWFISREQCDK